MKVLREFAEKWRDVSTVAEQNQIFEAHGVRWSELWRLPYWDPTRMLVIDSMHCLFEGLAKTHCRVVLDLSVASAEAPPPEIFAYTWNFAPIDPVLSQSWSKNDVKHITQIQKLLLKPIAITVDGGDLMPLYSHLKKKNAHSLKHICQELQCLPLFSPTVSKDDLAKALVHWRSQRPFQNTDPSPVRVVTPAVIGRIQCVLRDMVKPSWMKSLPSNFVKFFGTATGGSPKADEWREFFTVYLPVALISLWGDGMPQPDDRTATHCRKVLDNTMSLVSAIVVGTSHYMTAHRAEAYRECIRSYVGGLSELYTHMDPRTNEHVVFHIYDFLKLYGPVRSWWCFPFERLVGVLQSMPSNHKFGKQNYLPAFSAAG